MLLALAMCTLVAFGSAARTHGAGAKPKAPAKAAAKAPAIPASTPLSPFSDIHSGTLSDYDTYQIKFTYLGAQKKIVPSLAGVGPGRAYDATAFVTYERDVLDYGNDAFTPDTLHLGAAQLKGFVDAIALQPPLTDNSLVADPNASLMILRDSGPATKCWEHLATQAETDELFQLLRDQVTAPADTGKVSSYRRQMAGVRR